MTLPLVVTSTVLNAEKYVGRCVESVARQTVLPDKHYIADAASDDETQAQLLNAQAEAGRLHVELFLLQERASIFSNLLPIWRLLPDETIIVWLDGDDWLATDYALAQVLKEHEAGAYVTYGQFMWRDGTLGFADRVGINPRTEPWRATHLKTFRAGLVNRIRDEDFRDRQGAYNKYATDQTVMLPCLEMAAGRAAFIPNILYVYNNDHSMQASEGTSKSEEARFLAEEHAAVAWIRGRPRYRPVRL